MADSVQGGCRCGAVRYTSDAQPTFSAHCHCRDCQYSSGTGYATLFIVPAAAFNIEGEVRGYAVQSDSGNEVTRSFCPTCGTPVFSELAANPGIVAVKAATLDNPSIVSPQMHIWTASAQPWAETGELPTFEKSPG